jgi:hypothetical protein
MAETFEVLGLALENQDGPIQFKDGTNMNKFLLDLKRGPDDLMSGVAHWRKADQGDPPFDVGDTINGEVANAARGGLKISRVNLGEAASPSPNGAGAKPRQDATGRSIERQVALKAAVELAGSKDGNPTPEWVTETAGIFDAFLRNDVPEGGDEDVPF